MAGRFKGKRRGCSRQRARGQRQLDSRRSLFHSCVIVRASRAAQEISPVSKRKAPLDGTPAAALADRGASERLSALGRVALGLGQTTEMGYLGDRARRTLALLHMPGSTRPRHADPRSGSLVGKRITVCVTGSVAAYKAVTLIRLLMRAGASVQALMTRSAGHFVGSATLSGLTGRPVPSDMFEGAGEPHVEIARTSDLAAVVPATADMLARLAAGRADDLVAATLMCCRCPVLIAPAMHPNMWNHPLTQANVERLRSVAGWTLIGPVDGEVASGESGLGRLVEPEDIFSVIEAAVAAGARSDEGRRLDGRHIVVTAGPTLEDLDPVRTLTNRSSGKMGFALARSCALRGARVTLISGPVSLATPSGVARVDVRSALEMRTALAAALGAELADADALVMCAAVSDYRPKAVSSSKLKRKSAELSLTLVANPDLLAEVGQSRVGERPLLIGFAVESTEGAELVAGARHKLASKRVDAIVANTDRVALGGDATAATLVTLDAERPLGPGPKTLVSEEIVDFIAGRLA